MAQGAAVEEIPNGKRSRLLVRNQPLLRLGRSFGGGLGFALRFGGPEGRAEVARRGRRLGH